MGLVIKYPVYTRKESTLDFVICSSAIGFGVGISVKSSEDSDHGI